MTSARRLILVRHGPSAHAHRGLLDRSGVLAWRDAYDAAGIVADCTPPASLTEVAAGAGHLIASDMRRAVESARRLAPGREILTSPLLREAPPAIPSWPTRLPFGAWAAAISVGGAYRRLRGTDLAGADFERATEAADWLGGVVGEGTTAIVVTHGVMRDLLARLLVQRGWAAGLRDGGYRHWSAWHLVASGR